MKKKELLKSKHLETVATTAGVGLGFGAASAIGTAVGSAGLLGTIGSVFGYTVAASTPVGWLIGGAIAGGVALKYGAKLIGAKGKSDGICNIMEHRLIEQKQQKMQRISAKLSQADIKKAINLWEKISQESLTESDVSTQIIDGLKSGVGTPNEAIELACEILGYDINQFLNEKQLTIEELNIIVALAVVMMTADNDCKQEEFDTIIDVISDHYMIEKSDADYILSVTIENYLSMHESAKVNINPKIIFIVAAECFYLNTHLQKQILNILEKVALADGIFDKEEKALLDFAERCFTMAQHTDNYDMTLASLPKNEPNLFLSSDAKFEKKLASAIESYGVGLNPKEVIAIYDNTTFGKADKGFILNKLGLISDQGDILFYNEIERAKPVQDGMIIRTKYDDIVINCKINQFSQLTKFFNTISEIKLN